MSLGVFWHQRKHHKFTAKKVILEEFKGRELLRHLAVTIDINSVTVSCLVLVQKIVEYICRHLMVTIDPGNVRHSRTPGK